MKNKKLLLGIGVLALVLVAGFLASGRSLQGAARNARNTPAAPVTLTFAASPNPVVGGEIVAGAQAFASTGYGGVLVARYQVTASGPANNQVTITDLNFENDYNDQNPLANNGAISQVALYFPTSYSSPSNLNGVAFAILNLDGQAEFSGLNFKLRGGVPTQFEVQVTTNPLDLDIPAGDQIEMDLSPKYSAVNNRTGAIIEGEVLPDGIDGPEFTLIGGAEETVIEEENIESTLVPTVDLKLNNSNGPVNVPSGNSVTVSWTSSNATSCSLSTTSNMGTSTVSKATSGSYYFVAYGTNTISTLSHTMTCTGPGGNGSDTVVLTVNPSTPPPPPPSTGNSAAASPTVNLLVNGSNGPVTTTGSIAQGGGTVNLTWSNTNVSSSGGICTKSSSIPMASWSGNLPSFQNTSGGAYYLNVPTSRTFTLTCTTPAGTAQDSVGVNVPAATPPPPSPPPGTGNSATASPIVNLFANGSSGPITTTGNAAQGGGTVLLSWSNNSNAASSMGTICTKSSSIPTTSWSGNLPSYQNINGAAYLNIPTSRTFTLSCTNSAGTGQDSVEVNVPN